MERLSDERLARMITESSDVLGKAPDAIWHTERVFMATELQQLRAAKAADRERVWIEVSNALLRAVDRLMGRSYSDENPGVHTWMRAIADNAADAISTTDPIRTAIRALLASDKPAGELRAALEEMVGS